MKSPKARRRPDSNPQRGKRSTLLSAPKLDALVREAVVDCYDDAEQAMGLFTMIEENLKLPFETKVPGIPVDVVSVDIREITTSSPSAKEDANVKPYRCMTSLSPLPRRKERSGSQPIDTGRA